MERRTGQAAAPRPMDATERNKREWWIWHNRNPEIQDAFDSIALKMIDLGHKHYSATGIAHVLRYHRHLCGDDGFDINNNHIPSMARMFMHTHKQHEGFFHLRQNGGRIPEGAHHVTEDAPRPKIDWT
jgi:hypothetical protein